MTRLNNRYCSKCLRTRRFYEVGDHFGRQRSTEHSDQPVQRVLQRVDRDQQPADFTLEPIQPLDRLAVGG